MNDRLLSRARCIGATVRTYDCARRHRGQGRIFPVDNSAPDYRPQQQMELLGFMSQDTAEIEGI